LAGKKIFVQIAEGTISEELFVEECVDNRFEIKSVCSVESKQRLLSIQHHRPLTGNLSIKAEK
jgi:hypothetical protein